METTTFLAQIWGPVILAGGLGIFTSKNYYTKVYRELERAPFAVIYFGMVAIAAGVVHIGAHNVWGTFQESLISFFGWGLLLKGVICTVFPKLADKSGDWWADTKLISTAGLIMVILGVYLSWVGYLAA